MVEDLRLGFDHHLQAVFPALEIRDQHFNLAAGGLAADLADGLGENLCATHVVVIPIYAGDNGVLQPQCSHSFSDAPGLVPVQRFRSALGHRTEPAAPGTEIAQQHEGCGLMVPALANVRALRRFTDRMQI